ncbi:hypothetical protein HWQ46_20295 [Shewanella sp. D64]|uniref:hypothetical protein n=1 Tax=unclassified Shewanella TaxID=196818 RepID=UPI0022BA30F9|nr:MULTISPECIES: hypothetical protein [unclassified Shewanella]MEC4727879.1 hypothetical protein [Shewanella sp. D64]MEC4739921.1 hypothetical protein [Shewanella sp. E94]WBJ97114.1 hypothetical protein HWQ47_08415 [Shewanella sp. MTB7]
MMTVVVLTRGDIYRLFSFLSSETPAELTWIKRYLSKCTVMILGENPTLFDIKEQVYLQYKQTGSSSEGTFFYKRLAEKMYKSYKARLYRKKQGARKMLNVTITPKHMHNLEDICKYQDKQKNKVIEMMIEGSISQQADYIYKLKSEKKQNETTLKIIRDKQRLDVLTNKSKMENDKNKSLENIISNKDSDIELLKENISLLIETIKWSHRKDTPIKFNEYDDAITIFHNSINI